MIAITRPNVSKGKERRQARRLSLDAHASIPSISSADYRMIICDVSETGLQLQGSADLDVGSSFPLEFMLPNGHQVTGKAQVVWKRPDSYVQSYGAQIVEMSWLKRRKLRGFLTENQGESGYMNPYWALGACFVAAVAMQGFLSLLTLGLPAVFLGTVAGVSISLYLLSQKPSRF